LGFWGKTGAPVSQEIERILNPFLQRSCTSFVLDDINTASGKKIAAERHAFIETYLQQFYNEWDGLK
jgi:hypothetical protein